MTDIVQQLRMIVASGNGGAFEQIIIDASDTIEQLRDIQEWIPVGDRLPDTQDAVLACFVDSKGVREVCESIHFKDRFFSVGDYGTYEATHWRPLPPPPPPCGR